MAPLFTGFKFGFAGGGSSLLEWRSTSPSSVSWTLTNTLSSQGETLIQPASQYNVAKLLIWGGGGSASFESGGNGGAGGYTEVYFTLSPTLRNFLAVVGGAGAQAQNATAYTRLQENGTPHGDLLGPRSFGNGGPPSTQALGGGAQLWAGGGGGLSGVFWADSVLTSTNGSKFFYCTPIAIAGGGGGGTSYNRHAWGGGLRETFPTAEDVTYTRGTDAQSTSQFANVRYGTNQNLYLRAYDGVDGVNGNVGGGYVGGYNDGTSKHGGASFVWSSITTPPIGVGVVDTRSLLTSFPGFIHPNSYATTEAQTGITQTPFVTTNRPGSAGQGGSVQGGLGTAGAILVYMGTI